VTRRRRALRFRATSRVRPSSSFRPACCWPPTRQCRRPSKPPRRRLGLCARSPLDERL